MAATLHCYGFNIERYICEYGITDISDIALIGKACELRAREWMRIDDLRKQVRECATKHVLDRVESILYHRDEYECGSL